MRIAVIGAGMAGVAAAQALAADGHDVTVIERRSSVAEETSFAPAGIAAAGLAAPWLPAPGRLQARDADELARLRGTGTAFARPTLFGKGDAAEAERRAQRALALYRLLALGIERIDALALGLSLDFECCDGLLLTLPDAASVAQAEVALAWLQEAGDAVEWADAALQRKLEPGRALADPAARAVFLPNARIGNTREWTQLLRAHGHQLGVRFLFQHEVQSVTAGPQPVLRYTGADGAQEAAFDAVVVCAALESARLLAPLGVKLPWKPIRSYSVTVAQHVREAAPDSGLRAALLDVRSGISISRLGARVRVAGGHEAVPVPAGSPAEPAAPPARKAIQPLYQAVDEAFPGAVNWQAAQVWQATRAALPDGLPAIGASGAAGIWLNVGHAHHGWALSQTAADLLCMMIAGDELPPEAGILAPQRLR